MLRDLGEQVGNPADSTTVVQKHQGCASKHPLPVASSLSGMDVWSRQHIKAGKICCNLLSHLQVAKYA